jgi:glucokinase
VILAGDIGGTKCNLALYDIHGVSPKKIFAQRYESHDFPTFDQMIAKFLSKSQSESKMIGDQAIEAAGFGVAGPVIERQVKATNLPWIVDAAALSTQ